jgi:hypothetical protein
LEESKGFVNARQNGDHLGAKCLAPTARIHASLGYRPRTGAISKTRALKARFNPESRHETGNESRFQPRKLSGLPQANQVIAAPSALIVFETRARTVMAISDRRCLRQSQTAATDDAQKCRRHFSSLRPLITRISLFQIGPMS